MDKRLSAYAPFVLSLLRIVAALLFVDHGSAKLLGFPHFGTMPHVFTLFWWAGILELVGGSLLVLGLFTRPVAFLLSGEMAIAYFRVFAAKSFFPLVSGGDSAILFCFVFFYLVFAGAGPISIDALRRGR